MNSLRILAVVLSTFASAGAMAAACDGFVDVDSSDTTYCTAVSYVKDRGVTVGCTDSTHYCPNDYVTRLQMALFMQRMGRADPSNTLGDHTTAIGGGTSNTATGSAAFVGGGNANIATGSGSSVLGGYNNTASGDFSVVLGGNDNSATHLYSTAIGIDALADQVECVVVNLWSTAMPMTCGGSANVFRLGLDHGLSIDYYSQTDSGFGTRFVGIGDLSPGKTIATWTGAFLSDAGVWTNVSDQAKKEDFTPIDNSAILERVVQMPVERWRYKAEPEATHIGPVAQDFYAAFNVGSDDTHITTIDEGGVALAAIQGLNAKLIHETREKDARIADLTARLERLEKLIAH